MPREIIRSFVIAILLTFLAAVFLIQFNIDRAAPPVSNDGVKLSPAGSFSPAQLSSPPASSPIISNANSPLTVQLGAVISSVLEVGAKPHWSAVIIGLIGLTTALVSIGLALFLAGFSLVTFSWFGAAALNLFIVALISGLELRRLHFVLFTRGRIRLRDVEQGIVVVSMFVLLLFLLGTALTFLAEFDPLMLSSILETGGSAAAAAYLGSGPAWFAALLRLSGWITAVLLLYHLLAAQCFYPEYYAGRVPRGGQAPPVFQPLINGIAAGAFASAAAGVLQIAGVQGASGRGAVGPGPVAATLGSAAAFGAAAVLIIPLLLLLIRGGERKFAAIAAISFGLISLWSGSRPEGIGLLIFWLWYASGRIVIDRSRPRFRHLIWILILTAAAIAFGYPPLNSAIRSLSNLPPSIQRGLELVDWESGAAEIARQSAMAGEYYQLWRSHPLIGIGIGRLQSGGITPGSRSSFFLLILAETGLLGIILFSVALVLFSKMLRGEPAVPGPAAEPSGEIKEKADEELEIYNFAPASESLFISRGLLLTVLILLLIGSQLLFDEYRYLVFAVLALGAASASSAEARRIFQARRLLFLMTLLLPIAYAWGVITSSRLHLERGLYRSESEEGRIIAWTAREAQIGICRADGPVVLNLRSGDGEISQHPVAVSVWRGRNEDSLIGEILLSDNQWHELVIAGQELETEQLPVVFRLRVSRMWQRSSDRRWQGVAIEWSSGMCPWAR